MFITMFLSCFCGISFAQNSEENRDGFEYLPKNGGQVFISKFENTNLENQIENAKCIYLFSKKNIWEKIHKESESCKTVVLISYTNKPIKQQIFDKTKTSEMATISENLNLLAERKCGSESKKLEIEWKIKKSGSNCTAQTIVGSELKKDQSASGCDLYSYIKNQTPFIDETIDRFKTQ